MLPSRNPAHGLLATIRSADWQAVTTQHLARCQGLPEAEARYHAYRTFRRTLYQSQPRPMSRLKALTYALSLLGLLATLAWKGYLAFAH